MSFVARTRAALDDASTKWWWWTLAAAADLALSLAIIRFVPYTEIDFKAYMQEVEGPLLHDEWDYTKLRGDTGPLVYPAGFVWIYMAIRELTRGGTDLLPAQILFAGLHALLVFLVLGAIYYQPDAAKDARRVPFWVGPMVVISRRVHSIFVLRLFNDGIAMVIMYAALFLYVRRRWILGTLLFSAALSVKMNILLFAPGVAVLLLESIGLTASLGHAALCVGTQVAVAFPFLRANAAGYMDRAFELGRVFMFKWTVNFKFLDPETFVRKELALGLLSATLLTWLAFGQRHFAASHKGGLLGLVRSSLASPMRAPLVSTRVPAHDWKMHVTTTLLTSNFIGIAFARSMHYQFYSWYFHSLAFLAYASKANVVVAVLVCVTIEVCYNVYPATPLSSGLLQATHLLLLLRLWIKPPSTLRDGESRAKKA
ncbi:Dol-P-Man:Man5GlcNAc2-PP-Dol alpha-1,3-mannosyltransferase [Hondaea fermentalgiana]|uniref:dolichyl-P-Man:Man5GlcNAc2-PP-dolichol alpha-1,3-mannosyltransferase n=1 Tax=Hondaea fermentalgiana TaxID=2315210 RepID=A0A2R5GW40_9STRA|nr:Dol-P-Man:Man5GlcNAc2-PP-Dol alpha-1,3-mannosyltransferase [Hondaea fermentalgiana]|eukprot:GBG32154.1 Dol-P-Man:Man5GlcNAc2-PP-Dol alpha-1,3-mannosyltransferase [Hondaea fermentalgiana]